MRILQICKKAPWPLTDGESIAVHALSVVFAQENQDVDLLYMNTAKHSRNPESVVNGLSHYRSITTVDVDNRLSISKVVSNLFSNHPIHVQRLESDAFQTELTRILTNNEYDIIQIETIYPAQYIDTIRKVSDAKVVIRCHNVEHLIWQRQSESVVFWKRYYLKMQSARIKSFESEVLSKADVILPLSSEDELIMKGIAPNVESEIVPIGLDISQYRPKRPTANEAGLKSSSASNPLQLCFIGTLDWIPNSNGLLWFLREVWGKLHAELSGRGELHVAGRNMPDSIRSYAHHGVTIHGEVNSAIDFVSEYDVMIVPLFAGSGQRVKILEAMALGKTVISTTIGIEGIQAENGIHFLKADSISEFIAAIKSIMDNRSALEPQSISSFIDANHSHNTIANQLLGFYERLITKA